MACTVWEGEGSCAGHAMVDLGEIVIGSDHHFTLRRAEDGRYLGPEGWHETQHLWEPTLVEEEATTILHAGPAIGRWIGEETWVEIVLPTAAFRAKTTWPALSFAAPDGGRRRSPLLIDAQPVASRTTIPLPARRAPGNVQAAQVRRAAARTIDAAPLPASEPADEASSIPAPATLPVAPARAGLRASVAALLIFGAFGAGAASSYGIAAWSASPVPALVTLAADAQPDRAATFQVASTGPIDAGIEPARSELARRARGLDEREGRLSADRAALEARDGALKLETTRVRTEAARLATEATRLHAEAGEAAMKRQKLAADGIDAQVLVSRLRTDAEQIETERVKIAEERRGLAEERKAVADERRSVAEARAQNEQEQRTAVVGSVTVPDRDVAALATEAGRNAARCDALAGAEHDRDRRATAFVTDHLQIDTGAAIEACTAAIEAFPQERRLQTQIGRAYAARADGALRSGSAGAGAELFRKAVAAWERADASGSAHAAHLLGTYYAGSFKVADRHDAPASPDLARSARHFETASARGHLLAKLGLGHLFVKGDGVRQNIPRGFALMKEAGDAGYSQAHAALGEYLFYGHRKYGIEADPEHGAIFLDLAYCKNNRYAREVVYNRSNRPARPACA